MSNDETTKKILNATDILEADDIVITEVDVKEWGGTVRLKSLNAEEMGEFVDLTTGKNKGDAPIRVLMLSAIGVDGQALFPSGDDVETRKIISRLKKKSLRAFMRVQKKALEINGLLEEVVDVKND